MFLPALNDVFDLVGLSRIGLEESSTDPVQDPALVVLTSSALVLLVLVLLTVAILYCQQFWKSQCQHGEWALSAVAPPFPTLAKGNGSLSNQGFLCLSHILFSSLTQRKEDGLTETRKGCHLGKRGRNIFLSREK